MRLKEIARLTCCLALSVLGSAQPRKGPPPDGSENDIHIFGTIADVIVRAYQIVPQQLYGPSWLGARESSLNMAVHVPPGTTPEQQPQILQKILAQRFGLAMHKETRVMKVYAMEVAKGGAKIDETPSWDQRPPDCDAGQYCHGVSMAYLAWRLQGAYLGPILDRTDLKGRYDFKLPPRDVSRIRIGDFQPIQFRVQDMNDRLKPLGLAIREMSEPAEALVVDHCEKKPRPE